MFSLVSKLKQIKKGNGICNDFFNYYCHHQFFLIS